MDLEFDADKDWINRTKHGFSLQMALDFDLAEAVIEVDERYAYGETRYRAFGRIDGLGYCLAFTYRDDVVRAISFRRARDKEMKRYGR